MSEARQLNVSAADVRRDYEPLADSFEARWHSFHAATRQWVLAHWPDVRRDDARMLDVGCGVGGFLAAVHARHTGLDLVGIDLVPALLARAKRSVPTAMLVEADAADPPFAPAAFDIVASLNIMHHLNDPAAHIAGLAQLARPGGSVFLSTFAGRRTIAMRLADWWLKRRNPAWRGMLSGEEMRAVLANEARLHIAATAEIKAGRWWWLQLYRLDRTAQPLTAG